MPDRRDLDAAGGGRPVYLSRTCGHIAVASSAALARAGVSRDMPDPPGGVVDRDPAGEPTGVLRETALAARRPADPASRRRRDRARLLATRAPRVPLARHHAGPDGRPRHRRRPGGRPGAVPVGRGPGRGAGAHHADAADRPLRPRPARGGRDRLGRRVAAHRPREGLRGRLARRPHGGAARALLGRARDDGGAGAAPGGAARDLPAASTRPARSSGSTPSATAPPTWSSTRSPRRWPRSPGPIARHRLIHCQITGPRHARGDARDRPDRRPPARLPRERRGLGRRPDRARAGRDLVRVGDHPRPRHPGLRRLGRARSTPSTRCAPSRARSPAPAPRPSWPAPPSASRWPRRSASTRTAPRRRPSRRVAGAASRRAWPAT